MNERIKELMVELKKTVSTHRGDEVLIGYDELEKFAELIVRECARIAIAKQTENDIANIVSKNPAKDFAYALVEHFGVEE